MPEAPVLVTGGSGVVGSAVVRHLVAGGQAVRALVRSESAADAVRALGADPVRGDVLDAGSLVAAMSGCDVAYHVAGVNRFCVRDPSVMHRVNVEGSVHCVDAAARAGVRRLVYTSSAVTLGERHGEVGREDSAHRGSFISDYERSKFDAERAVARRATERGVDVVTVNPSSVQGPGRTSGTGQVLVQYLRGRLKAWVDTTISLVDIDDCAAGHLLAESNGVAGERYVLNAASITSDELLAIMTRIAPGVRPPRLVPRVVASAGVVATEAIARLKGKEPVVCRESLRAVLHGHRYDGGRAGRELGLRYRPAEETLARTAAWLAESGLVPVTALGKGGFTRS